MRTSTWIGLFSASAFGVVLACSKDEPVLPVGTPQTPLERDTQVRWIIENDPNTNTARLAFPVDPTPQILAPGADPAATAATFIAKYPETFGVGSAADLELNEADTDSTGVVHVSFSQKANGVAVKFARVAVHFDAQGGVDHVSGPFYPDLARVAAQSPAFDEAGALSRATARFASSRVTANGAARLGPSLDARTGALLLRYEVPVLVDGWPSLVMVDAITGTVFDVISSVQTLRASGTGADGRALSFDIDQPAAGQPFAMRFSGAGNRAAIDVNASPPNQTALPSPVLVTSPSSTTWEADAPPGGAGTAVDVMAKLQLVEGWYRAKLGRLSYDNKRGKISAFVYASDDPDFWPNSGVNGFWYGGGVMVYTVNQAKLGGIDFPFTDVDTCAHELMHGFTEYTSGLYYGAEPGGLNEGMSDIFGQLVEHDLLPGGDPALVGDEFDDVIRSMKDPRAFGGADHIDNISDVLANLRPGQDDNGGVHSLSGIPNLVWYLMTFGGDHPSGFHVDGAPLGYDRSRDLWWTLNRYELSQFSGFRDAAEKSLLIGRYRNFDRQIIGCAWQSVGVLTADELRTNYGISCTGPDAGTNALCQGQRGLVSFCHPTQENAAVVCQDDAFIEITLCPDEDEAGPISQKCTGTDGVDTDSGAREANIRCESTDPTIDSCAGKADGWYCSRLPGAEYAGYSCRNGARFTGQFCETGERCDGFDGETIRCITPEAGAAK